jgi:NAD(P)-dependent dehydrogenase (short-subunit alcohol dehydrogenase family)
MRRPSLSFWFALWLALVYLGTGRQFLLPLLIALVASIASRKLLFERVLQRSAPENAAVVITGCSTGFGKSFAIDLAQRGLTVGMLFQFASKPLTNPRQRRCLRASAASRMARHSWPRAPPLTAIASCPSFLVSSHWAVSESSVESMWALLDADVTKEEQIAAAVEFVRGRLEGDNKRLFALINNAGVHMLGARTCC